MEMFGDIIHSLLYRHSTGCYLSEGLSEFGGFHTLAEFLSVHRSLYKYHWYIYVVGRELYLDVTVDTLIETVPIMVSLESY